MAKTHIVETFPVSITIQGYSDKPINKMNLERDIIHHFHEITGVQVAAIDEVKLRPARLERITILDF